jgi:tetratricopeptide (TPR) repeat protein
VSIFLNGLVGILLAVTPPATSSRPTLAAPRASAAVDPNDPVEKEYEKLLNDDDAAQEEADKWIREADAFKAKGAPFSREALHGRIEQRFAPVRKAYEDFLQRHPDHVRARLAYGSFLYETNDEDAGISQWEKARELDPSNPAAWNNLANHYGHRGPVTKAFEYYNKAIELNPKEPVYLQNLATTMYLFRKDAMELYNIGEKEVFDRSLELYRKAIKLDPNNFPLATDYAQSYYGIKPLRTDEALAAWNYALKIANDDFERQGVYVHLARVELNSGQFVEARKHLDLVTNQFYNVLKDRLARNIVEKQKRGTNAPVGVQHEPATADAPAPATPQPRKAVVSKPTPIPPLSLPPDKPELPQPTLPPDPDQLLPGKGDLPVKAPGK